MKPNTFRTWALAVAAASALAACGGNDDEIYLPPVTQDPTMVPASALTSATAFSQYVASLPASDSGDPLMVSTLVPPTSDTDEPLAVVR